MSNREKELHDMAKKLMEMVNCFNTKSEGFAEVVCSDHRSLQQGAFRMFLTCIKKWAEAEKTNNFDLRNEATVKACSKIMKMLEVENMTHMPFI
jgi:hypothetical protein